MSDSEVATIATRCLEAWTSGDFPTARTLLRDDVTATDPYGATDGAENYLICFTRSGTCMIVLTNSDNGELAFRPLLEKLIGDNVTPWEWEGYTREDILRNEEHTRPK